MYAAAASDRRLCRYHIGQFASHILITPPFSSPFSYLLYHYSPHSPSKSPPPPHFLALFSHPPLTPPPPPLNRFLSQRPPTPLPLLLHRAMNLPRLHYPPPPAPHYPRHHSPTPLIPRPVKHPSQVTSRPVNRASVTQASGKLALVPLQPRPIPITQVNLLTLCHTLLDFTPPPN